MLHIQNVFIQRLLEAKEVGHKMQEMPMMVSLSVLKQLKYFNPFDAQFTVQYFKIL